MGPRCAQPRPHGPNLAQPRAKMRTRWRHFAPYRPHQGQHRRERDREREREREERGRERERGREGETETETETGEGNRERGRGKAKERERERERWLKGHWLEGRGGSSRFVFEDSEGTGATSWTVSLTFRTSKVALSSWLEPHPAEDLR